MLQQTGTITLAQIGTEAGDTNPTSISELYNGGANFPATTISPVSGTLPSSGQLNFSNFYGCIKRRPAQTFTSPYTLNNIIWTGSWFVAVGDSGRIMLTTDGVSWLNVSIATSINIHSIAFSGSEYIIATKTSGGTLRIYRNTDIQYGSWTLVYDAGSADASTYYSIAYGASKFVLIPSATALGVAFYSTNSTGTTWTFQTGGGPGGGNIALTNRNNLIWNGSNFVYCAAIYSRTSTTGTGSWSQYSYGTAGAGHNAGCLIGWNGSYYLAYSTKTSTGEYSILRSPDATTWTIIESGTGPLCATGIANSGSYSLTIKDNQIRRSSQSFTDFTNLTSYGTIPFAMAANSTRAIILANSGTTYDSSSIIL